MTPTADLERTAEALETSQQVLEGIINAIPVRVFWKDRNLVYLGCNAAFARDAGFSEPREIIGKDDYQMAWRAQAERYRSDDLQVIESGRAKLLIEEPQTAPDGQTITLLTNKLPLRDSRGEVSGVLGTYMDVTERKHAEEALVASETRYRRLFESSKDGILILDAETGMVKDVNPFLIEKLGFSREAFLGKRIWDLGFFRDIIANEARFAELQQHEYVRYEDKPLEAVDGSRMDVEFISNVYQVNGRKVIQCNIRDINARKKAEAAHRESAARLATIVDSAMDGFVTVDDQGTVLVFNAAAEAMFGCPAAEAIGQPVERFLPERFRAAHHGNLLRFGEAGSSPRAPLGCLRVGGLRVSGEEFPIEASISRSEIAGRPLFTILLRDISERERAEVARALLEVQFREAQKREALGTLASGIAHDFNNILGTILGNTELARQDVGANAPALEDLDEIRRASLRAKSLIQRILAFGSPSQDSQSVLSLRPVVEEALQLLRATLPAGIEMAATYDGEAPDVLADSSQVLQALINLGTNAWQAMEGGAGRIDIRLDGVTLDAEAARVNANLRPGPFARLSVTDTGMGMDAGTLQSIFDPFFTTKPVGQGSGLGLSVVQGTVKAHGGAITVASHPGEGTTFSLYFPAAKETEAAASAERPALGPATEAGGRHVLYLDDEESLVFLVSRMLRRLGYRVSGYTRADEALAAVRADPGQFDLVVTDLNMPGMSGLDVAREVARVRPGLPVILASGYISEELRKQAPEAGVRQLIYKPNTVEELCDAVRRLASGPKRD